VVPNEGDEPTLPTKSADSTLGPTQIADITPPQQTTSAPSAVSKDKSIDNIDPTLTQTTADEEAVIDEQINDFIANKYGADVVDPISRVHKSPLLNNAKQGATVDSNAQNTKARNIAIMDSSTSSNDTAANLPQNTLASPALSPEDLPSGAAHPISETAEVAPPATTQVPLATAAAESTGNHDGQVAHKKVIQPINDLHKPDTSISDLLQQEAEREQSAIGADSVGIPTNSVIMPGGQTVAPAAAPTTENEANINPHTPGNVIQPAAGSVDPNAIAL
jgi:hypothetical protein